MKRILVTGGAGFIGSAVVKQLVASGNWHVVNADALTYAANPASLASVAGHPAYRFEHVDVCDAADRLQEPKRIFLFSSSKATTSISMLRLKAPQLTAFDQSQFPVPTRIPINPARPSVTVHFKMRSRRWKRCSRLGLS